MTRDPDDGGNDTMRRAVRLREVREVQWKRTGERPLWRNLSMVGALGWLIVTPALLGVLLGRWLDVHLGTGIFWSGALIVLGIGVGGYLAWRRVGKE